MGLEVEWSRVARKALLRLDRRLQERITQAVDAYAEKGLGEVRRYLEGERGELALRVGEWRVFIVEDRASRVLKVNDVRARGSAYR